MKFRKNIRLKGYNYKTNGYYFITVCTYLKIPYLSEEKIKNIVVAELALLKNRFKGLKVDCYIIMPDHIHVILVLEDADVTLNQIIQAFKSITTIKVKKDSQLQTRLWQPNYYEHVIRNQQALEKIREYVIYNPEKDKIDFTQFYKK
jgi:REP element-mobilizing transposase RayT